MGESCQSRGRKDDHSFQLIYVQFSLQIRLDVQHKPEIEQEETFIHSRDGDEVEITCTIHASPKAEVEWYRNGQLLDPREMVTSTRGNRHTLMLHRIGKKMMDLLQLSPHHLENIIYHFPIWEK